MNHTIYFNAAQNMSQLMDKSVDLIVTSPPYPMVKMWDDIMARQNPAIQAAFDNDVPRQAFELMHKELDKVWSECWRVLKDGSFLCINIGDSTRTTNGDFSLYNNNTRITQYCENLGFKMLPSIIWKKVINAPNKFMGSGMLPCGAYVTLEHEWILIFRKGKKSIHQTNEQKKRRRESSFFWEERNIWFSAFWTINGVRQALKKNPSRERSASYPLEIPYRLINMYSIKGDLVLDPFIGLGTTTIASILSERNSVGYEIDTLLRPSLKGIIESIDVSMSNSYIKNRYKRHVEFIDSRISQNKDVKYVNPELGCKVITRQETDLALHYIKDIKFIEDTDKLVFESDYLMEHKLADGSII